jgi:RNase adapter protein RapZ
MGKKKAGNLKFVILTGYSGSGKSTALAAFEDAGFYCVDNLPVALLPKFLDLPIEQDFDTSGFAFGMDLREKGFTTIFIDVINRLKSKGYNFKILFLETDPEILLQRYSQTRRQHPLAKGDRPKDGIALEKTLLGKIRHQADTVIDTTRLTVHELKAMIQSVAKQEEIFIPMGVQILSFGFKYGAPPEADLLIDVRFLKNPYFIPELRDLDGHSPQVREYVRTQPDSRKFLKKYIDLLNFLIPRYDSEGKAYLTIAVGCTGGRHRSVSIAEMMFDTLDLLDRPIKITHRDIHR